MKDSKPEYKALVSYLKVALKDKLFLADTKKLKAAIKNGACSVSEVKSGLIAIRSGLQTHMRR
jgi:hypothetical protein